MKRFMTVGLILAIMAMGVFLACAGAAKKTKVKSKYMKITLSTETGQLVKVTDENNNPATELTPAELQQFYQTQATHVGTIFYTHSSPGCFYVIIGGRCYKICY
jgi:hypothetical protein